MRLLAALLFFSASLMAAPPNVLVIIADDLGYADIGVHGGKDVPTPHIDALAASGVRCSSGYVPAPYCSPSRAGFLTGKTPTRFGHEFNPHVGEEAKLGLPLDQRTIADRLKAAGYATSLIGKWHQGFDAAHHPMSRGFEEYFGFLVGGHNFILHKEAKPDFGTAHSHDLIYRGREVQHLDGFSTTLFTDEALSFMDRNQAKPWFLYLAYNAVHTPLEIDPKVESRLPAAETDAARRGYLALLLGLDDSIGRISEHLKKSGMAENTMVWFFSDNGGSGTKPFFAYNTGKNTPLRGDKGQTLEGGVRVPFFVSWPGKLPAGKVYDEPVSTLDVLPTSCALAGQPVEGSIEGVDLLPHLLGTKAGTPHEALYWRFGGQKAIRRGSWKLVMTRDMAKREDGPWQLFDLTQDVGEQQDLSAAKPELAAELKAEWEKWDSSNVAPLWVGSHQEDSRVPVPDALRKQKKGK
jgi:arylsulfatase A-like enzyme